MLKGSCLVTESNGVIGVYIYPYELDYERSIFPLISEVVKKDKKKLIFCLTCFAQVYSVDILVLGCQVIMIQRYQVIMMRKMTKLPYNFCTR